MMRISQVEERREDWQRGKKNPEVLLSLCVRPLFCMHPQFPHGLFFILMLPLPLGSGANVPGVSEATQNMAWAQHWPIVCMLMAGETISTCFISIAKSIKNSNLWMQALANLIILCTVVIAGLLEKEIVEKIKSSPEKRMKKLRLLKREFYTTNDWWDHKGMWTAPKTDLMQLWFIEPQAALVTLSGKTGTSSGLLIVDPLFSGSAGASMYLQ